MKICWNRTVVVGASSIAMIWLGCGGSMDSSTSGAGSGGVGGEANGAGGGGGGQVCVPGAIEPCYSGPAGTEGIGVCHAGERKCALDGMGFGECEHEVTPAIAEDCSTSVDDDCDGSLGGGPSATPALVSPSNGGSVPGPDITMTWTGGTPPYKVELAFDAAFTDLVMPPIATPSTSVTVPNINGGRFYWRVTSVGGCGPSVPTPLPSCG